jgi:hypothetical protein
MAIEQFKNLAASTLDTSIDGSQTTLDVVSAASFPSSGQFRIKVEDEFMLVTGVSSNTFTVTRGAEGTSGASHSAGVAVTHVLTAGALDKRIEDECLVDTFANRPTAGKAGRLFLPSDGAVLMRDTGSEWRGLGYLGRTFKQPQAVSNWTWVNQGGATATDDAGTIKVVDPAHNGLNARILKKSAPSTPYVITAAFTYQIFNPGTQLDGCSFGLCWRQSSDGKLILSGMRYGQSRGWGIWGEDWNSETARNGSNWTAANYDSTNLITPIPQVVWVRIEDDGSNRKTYVSFDGGLTWLQMLSEGRTTFLTGNEVGFFINNNVGSATPVFDNFIRLVSWEES